MAKAQMNGLYSEAPGTAWRYRFDDRPDWLIARRWISEVAVRSLDILDVGCADGRFLIDGVDAHHRRYGIEINPISSTAASFAGVKVVGKTLEDLAAGPDRQFDVITAFDVLEHVFDPRDFVLQATRLLREGGRLIVATGDLSAATFRFMGAAYWYASIAEHISFISMDWCEAASRVVGLRLARHERFAHQSGKFFTKLRQTVANAFYRVSPSTYSLLRQNFFRAKLTHNADHIDAGPPSWMTAQDHIIVEFIR